jgi:hypothetical protein
MLGLIVILLVLWFKKRLYTDYLIWICWGLGYLFGIISAFDSYDSLPSILARGCVAGFILGLISAIFGGLLFRDKIRRSNNEVTDDPRV